MTRDEHLLTILGEECNEVAHRVSKVLRFGLNEVQPGQPYTNAERMRRELQDLLATWEMLDLGTTETLIDNAAFHDKQRQVEKFLLLSRQCGTLQE